MARRIIKGDLVVVISGNHKGKTSTVDHVCENKAILSGDGFKVKKHIKRTQSESGRVEYVDRYIDLSNLAHARDGKATKVGFRINGAKKELVYKSDGTKVRSV